MQLAKLYPYISPWLAVLLKAILILGILPAVLQFTTFMFVNFPTMC